MATDTREEDEEMPRGFFKMGSVTKTANPELRREMEERIRKRENAGGAAGNDSERRKRDEEG